MANTAKIPELKFTVDGIDPETWHALREHARAHDATWRNTEDAAETLGMDEVSTLKYLCSELLNDKMAARARSVELAKKLGA